MTALEAQRVPAVFVASSEFAPAADAQGAALGFRPAAVYVAHPVQDRTDDEMRALADDAVAGVWASLSQASRG